MTEHVTAWLGAYHDGELQGRRLHQVESHLEKCATCRAELENLQALAELLQQSPAAEGLTPPERFVAQVGLQLPRRPERTAWRRGLEIGWRLVPLGLFGAWTFVQVVSIVSGLVLVALRLGLGDDVAAGLLPAAPQGPSLAEMLSLPGAGLNDVGQVMLRLLERGGPLGWGFALHLVSLALIGLLYWSWLATWWARRRHRAAHDLKNGSSGN